MYFVTVDENEEELVRREPFEDFGAALAFLAQYYRPKTPRSVLEFTTEVINGKFARSYTTLCRPERLDRSDPHFEARHALAVRQDEVFDYDQSYVFLIETERGVHDADEAANDEND